MADYTVTTQLLLDSSEYTAGFTQAQVTAGRAFATIATSAQIASDALLKASVSQNTLNSAEAKGAIIAQEAAASQVNAAHRIESANLGVAESFNTMGVKGAMATLGIVIGIGAMAKSAIQAQSDLETMSTALTNLGMGDAIAQFDEFTSSNVSLGFSLHETASNLQKYATLTKDTTDAIRLNALTMDIARANHESLASAQTKVVMMMRGAQRGFQQFGVTLDTTLPKAQAINKALNEVQQKVAGQMQKYLETTAGKMDVLKASFGKIADVIGGYVLPVINDLLGLIQKFLPEIAIILGIASAAYAVVKAYKAVVLITTAWKKAQEGLNAAQKFNLWVIAIAALVAIVLVLWNRFKIVRDIIVDIANVILHAFGNLVKFLGWVAEQALKIFTAPLQAILKLGKLLHIPGAEAGLKLIKEGIDKIGDAANAAGNKINSFQKTIDKLRNMKISNPFDTKNANIDDKSKIAIENLPIPDTSAAAASQTAQDYADALKKLNDDIQNALDKLRETRQKGSDAISAIITSTFGNPSDFEKAFTSAEATADSVLREYEKMVSAIQDRMAGYAEADRVAALDALENATGVFTTLINKRNELNKQIVDAQDTLDNELANQKSAMESMARGLIDYGVSAGILTKNASDTIIRIVKTSTGAIVTQGDVSANAVDSITSALKNRLQTMQNFLMNIKSLQARGLNADYIKQLLNAGVESAGETVATLSTATDAQLSVINSTYQQINDVANNFADTTGKDMYSAGVLSAQSYVDGLKEKQASVQAEMDSLAKTIQNQLAALVPMTANIGKDTATALLDELAKYINDPANQAAVLANAQSLADKIAAILKNALAPVKSTSQASAADAAAKKAADDAAAAAKAAADAAAKKAAEDAAAAAAKAAAAAAAKSAAGVYGQGNPNLYQGSGVYDYKSPYSYGSSNPNLNVKVYLTDGAVNVDASGNATVNQGSITAEIDFGRLKHNVVIDM